MSDLTELEGIVRGTIINRPDGPVDSLLTPAAREGHTQFRAKFTEATGWMVSETGIVCFCVQHIHDNWKQFRVVTVPKRGMFCHTEPLY